MGLSRQGSVAEPSRRRLPSPIKRQPYNQPQAVPSPHRCSVGCGRGQGASGVAQPRGAWRQEGAKPCGAGVPLPDSALAGAGWWWTGPAGAGGEDGSEVTCTAALGHPPPRGSLLRPRKGMGAAAQAVLAQPPRCGRPQCGPGDGLLLPRRPAVEAMAPCGLSSWRQPNPSASPPRLLSTGSTRPLTELLSPLTRALHKPPVGTGDVLDGPEGTCPGWEPLGRRWLAPRAPPSARPPISGISTPSPRPRLGFLRAASDL